MVTAAFALLTTIALTSIPNEHRALNPQQEECFATSMIGYDYVINARAGVPIERALNTVTLDPSSPGIRSSYKTHLTTVVNNAYLWQGSPHTYATKVMHDCAFMQGAKKATE